MRVAYLTGQYPRATDTFIQREVAALRDSGVHVQTFSIRKPPMNENVGPEQQAERERTAYILPPSFINTVRALGRLKFGASLVFFASFLALLASLSIGTLGFAMPFAVRTLP